MFPKPITYLRLMRSELWLALERGLIALWLRTNLSHLWLRSRWLLHHHAKCGSQLLVQWSRRAQKYLRLVDQQQIQNPCVDQTTSRFIGHLRIQFHCSCSISPECCNKIPPNVLALCVHFGTYAREISKTFTSNCFLRTLAQGLHNARANWKFRAISWENVLILKAWI